MLASVIGSLAPAALLCAALVKLDVVSLLFLLAFALVQLSPLRREAPPRGTGERAGPSKWAAVILLAAIVITLEAAVEVAYASHGDTWPSSVAAKDLLDLLGLSSLDPWRRYGRGGVFTPVLVSFVPQLLVAFTAACALYVDDRRPPCVPSPAPDGSRVDTWRCVLRRCGLPVVQLAAGCISPAYASLPYYAATCATLLHWAWTAQPDALHRVWRFLQLYTGCHFILLYVYQLPLAGMLGMRQVAEFAGLHLLFPWELAKWPYWAHAGLLLLLYTFLSMGIHDTAPRSDTWRRASGHLPPGSADLLPARAGPPHVSLTVPLLDDASWWHTPLPFPQDVIYRRVCINVHTYALPVYISILFAYAMTHVSLLAFPVLLYIIYLLLFFPPATLLRRINAALVTYVIAWATASYIFNVAEAGNDSTQDMWRLVGLWRYSFPGARLALHFGIALLPACHLYASAEVSRSKRLSEEEEVLPTGEPLAGAADEGSRHTPRGLWIACILWCARRLSFWVGLGLLFAAGCAALDLAHAAYLAAFAVFILAPTRGASWWRLVAVYSAAHFLALYSLALPGVSVRLSASAWGPLLGTLVGVDQDPTKWTKVAVVAASVCFSALQCSGLRALQALDVTIWQHGVTPGGWALLAGRSRGELRALLGLSEKLGGISRAGRELGGAWGRIDHCVGIWQGCSTYVAYAGVLYIVCSIRPTYVGAGYLLLLLLWFMRQQLTAAGAAEAQPRVAPRSRHLAPAARVADGVEGSTSSLLCEHLEVDHSSSMDGSLAGRQLGHEQIVTEARVEGAARGDHRFSNQRCSLRATPLLMYAGLILVVRYALLYASVRDWVLHLWPVSPELEEDLGLSGPHGAGFDIAAALWDCAAVLATCQLYKCGKSYSCLASACPADLAGHGSADEPGVAADRVHSSLSWASNSARVVDSPARVPSGSSTALDAQCVSERRPFLGGTSGGLPAVAFTEPVAHVSRPDVLAGQHLDQEAVPPVTVHVCHLLHLRGLASWLALGERFLILHCGKMLVTAAFCAAVTPVSAAGLGFVVLIVVTYPMPKTSRLPAQAYAAYTTLYAAAGYVFQLAAPDLGLLPGQPHADFAQWLGFQIFQNTPSGLAAGLLSKLVVLAACALQHVTFHWLEQLPPVFKTGEALNGEPCLLFAPPGRPSRQTSGIQGVGFEEPGYGQESPGGAPPRIGQSGGGSATWQDQQDGQTSPSTRTGWHWRPEETYRQVREVPQSPREGDNESQLSSRLQGQGGGQASGQMSQQFRGSGTWEGQQGGGQHPEEGRDQRQSGGQDRSSSRRQGDAQGRAGRPGELDAPQGAPAEEMEFTDSFCFSPMEAQRDTRRRASAEGWQHPTPPLLWGGTGVMAEGGQGGTGLSPDVGGKDQVSRGRGARGGKVAAEEEEEEEGIADEDGNDTECHFPKSESFAFHKTEKEGGKGKSCRKMLPSGGGEAGETDSGAGVRRAQDAASGRHLLEKDKKVEAGAVAGVGVAQVGEDRGGGGEMDEKEKDIWDGEKGTLKAKAKLRARAEAEDEVDGGRQAQGEEKQQQQEEEEEEEGVFFDSSPTTFFPPITMRRSASRRTLLRRKQPSPLPPPPSSLMWRHKRERYKAQLAALRAQTLHTWQHFAGLYGVEVFMLGLCVASFSIKNVYSLAYVAILGLCTVVPRARLNATWPFLVLLLGGILLVQYVALAGPPPPWWGPSAGPSSPGGGAAEESRRRNCEECWRSTDASEAHCWSCWLGTVVDDRQIVAAHFFVFFLACMQLRVVRAAAAHAHGPAGAHLAPPGSAAASPWLDLSQKSTAAAWTGLDQLRFLFFRHLLHFVLIAVFVTGTLEYDLLHFGYLALALGCFRLRPRVLRQRTRLFACLRAYNFALIFASLCYQAPYFPYTAARSCQVFTLVGLYKYDYGFRITARSAVVDIVIFVLIGLQAYLFRAPAFRQVVLYLDRHQENERQMAQERLAIWKEEHLQYVRALEDKKAQRRAQVRKMKEAMAHLQLRLDLINDFSRFSHPRPYRSSSYCDTDNDHNDGSSLGLSRLLSLHRGAAAASGASTPALSLSADPSEMLDTSHHHHHHHPQNHRDTPPLYPSPLSPPVSLPQAQAHPSPPAAAPALNPGSSSSSAAPAPAPQPPAPRVQAHSPSFGPKPSPPSLSLKQQQQQHSANPNSSFGGIPEHQYHQQHHQHHHQQQQQQQQGPASPASLLTGVHGVLGEGVAHVRSWALAGLEGFLDVEGLLGEDGDARRGRGSPPPRPHPHPHLLESGRTTASSSMNDLQRALEGRGDLEHGFGGSGSGLGHGLRSGAGPGTGGELGGLQEVEESAPGLGARALEQGPGPGSSGRQRRRGRADEDREHASSPAAKGEEEKRQSFARSMVEQVARLIRGNSDVVTGVFMVAAFCWNFSLLTLVFPAGLFCYALVKNPGPRRAFWTGMLIYAELLVAVEYLYQIPSADRCLPAAAASWGGGAGHSAGAAASSAAAAPSWLLLLGIKSFPAMFVYRVLPLFAVYLALLVRSSAHAVDGHWLLLDDDAAAADAGSDKIDAAAAATAAAATPAASAAADSCAADAPTASSLASIVSFTSGRGPGPNPGPASNSNPNPSSNPAPGLFAGFSPSEGFTLAQMQTRDRPRPVSGEGGLRASSSRAGTGWRGVKARVRALACSVGRFLRAAAWGSEAPPYFVQMAVHVFPLPPSPPWQAAAMGQAGPQPQPPVERQVACDPKSLARGVNALLARSARERGVSIPSRVRVHAVKECSPQRQLEEGEGLAVVLEVVYASAKDAEVAPPGAAAGAATSEAYRSLTPAADVASELAQYREPQALPPGIFPCPAMVTSVVAGGKREVDLYAYTFGADLLAFVYVVLFYQAAVKDKLPFSDEVYGQEDQFPKDFVGALMVQFFLIVLHRVLYLTGGGPAKVAYHVATLALFTGSLMQLFWNSRLEASHATFRIFYALKALSFALVALQIRHGPPLRSRGQTGAQFLTRRVTRLRQRGFQAYRALPFLYELRSVLDWACSPTALPLYDWLKLEDIYGSLFLIACDIRLNRSKHAFGARQPPAAKLCLGALVLTILISVIWAPMLIYSTGNPTNLPNPVEGVHLRVVLDTFEGTFPLYETGGRRRLVDPGPDWDISADDALKTHEAGNVRLVCCYEDADRLWGLPPPSLQKMRDLLADNRTFLRTRWDFYRARPVGKERVSWEDVYTHLNATQLAQGLRRILNSSAHGEGGSLNLPHLYPKYWHVPGTGKATMLESASPLLYVGGNLTLRADGMLWWSFTRDQVSPSDGCGGRTGPIAVTVSEQVPAGVLGEALQKFTITGLYITFVLAVGRFIRFQCSGLRMRVPFENFPTCHRLIALCEDIYVARAEGELELEEGLFWTLVKIYRSPHILLEYTKLDKREKPDKVE